ncbi:MAG TPA: hypothetical protein VN688_03820 [Gemmataceae bacterium]|nr:hypothetical protein [Gemmataceae bacterium]
MSRRIGIVCACALLVAVAGCSIDSFSVSLIGSVSHRQVVAGSVEQASLKLQEGLTEAGVVVLVKPQDEGTRLFCRTKSGKMFCLLLNQEKTKGSDKTAVTMSERAVDEQFWGMVVKILKTPLPTSDDSLRLLDATERNDITRE